MLLRRECRQRGWVHDMMHGPVCREAISGMVLPARHLFPLLCFDQNIDKQQQT
jgi:hypothetical protein